MNKRLIPVALFLALGISLYFAGQYARNNPLTSTKPAQKKVGDLKELSHFTGIEFPAQAKIVRSQHIIGEQQHLYAVLHLPRQTALDFTRTLYQKGYSASKTGSSLPGIFNTWLGKQKISAQPISLGAIRNYRAMEITTPTRSGSLLADFDRPKVAVIYVYYELA